MPLPMMTKVDAKVNVQRHMALWDKTAKALYEKENHDVPWHEADSDVKCPLLRKALEEMAR